MADDTFDEDNADRIINSVVSGIKPYRWAIGTVVVSKGSGRW